MRGEIKYIGGDRKYFVNGHEVSKEGYDLCFPSKLEEIFESGQCPHIVTDSVFMKGHCNGSQFAHNQKMGDLYARRARKAGVNIKGKRYMHSLARFPGDPEAWIDGRGDVKRLCEQRGDKCEGMVNVKAREPEEAPAPPKGGVADHILEERVNQEIATEVEPRKESRQERKERIRDKIAPAWAK